MAKFPACGGCDLELPKHAHMGEDIQILEEEEDCFETEEIAWETKAGDIL